MYTLFYSSVYQGGCTCDATISFWLFPYHVHVVDDLAFSELSGGLNVIP